MNHTAVKKFYQKTIGLPGFIFIMLFFNDPLYGQEFDPKWEISADIKPIVFGKYPTYFQIERRITKPLSISLGFQLLFDQSSGSSEFNDLAYLIRRQALVYDSTNYQNGLYLGLKWKKNFKKVVVFLNPNIFYSDKVLEYAVKGEVINGDCTDANGNTINPLCATYWHSERREKIYGINAVLGLSKKFFQCLNLSFESSLSYNNYKIVKQKLILDPLYHQNTFPPREPAHTFEKRNGKSFLFDPFFRLRFGILL